MKYKLIAVDLDGTLLGSDHRISPENINAMKALKELGVTIIINTGRTYFEMPESVRSCKYVDCFICSNGTMIYGADGSIKYKNCMPDAAFLQAFDTLCEYKTNMNIHDHGRTTIDADKASVECFLEHNTSIYTAHAFLKFCEKVENFNDYYHKNLDIEQICCYFKFENEKEECFSRLQKIEGIQTAASSKYNIEIFNADVSKGKAIVMIAKALGVDMSEVIVAGDSLNDKPMFEVGAYGIAVANAMPQLKDAADETGCACEEHIMRYILKKKY